MTAQVEDLRAYYDHVLREIYVFLKLPQTRRVLDRLSSRFEVVSLPCFGTTFVGKDRFLFGGLAKVALAPHFRPAPYVISNYTTLEEVQKEKEERTTKK